MKNKTLFLVSIALSGVFLFLDQLLKYIARTFPDNSVYLIKSWLGWEYYVNKGIAFSLPFPQMLLIMITPAILLWLFFVIYKKKKKNTYTIFGLCLVLSGAISNLIDRIFFHATIDYIRILTSVMNLADIMIVVGVLLIFYKDKKKDKLII
jgi:signal peptidase II